MRLNLLPTLLKSPQGNAPRFKAGGNFTSIDPELREPLAKVLQEDLTDTNRDNWFNKMAEVSQMRDTYKALHDDDDSPATQRMNPLSKVLLKNNIIFINGALTPALSDVVMQKVMLLVSAMRQLEKRVPIRFVINSWGGSLEALGGILNAMNMAKRTVVKNKNEDKGQNIVVETFNMGYAGNSSSLILTNGTPGHRSMGPFSTLTLNQPVGGMSGDATNVRLEAERMNMHLRFVVDHLKKTTKIPHNLLDTMFDPAREDESILAREHDYEAPKCLEWGLVDKIVTTFPTMLDLEDKDVDLEGAAKTEASSPEKDPPEQDNYADPTATLDDLFSDSAAGLDDTSEEPQS